MKKPDERCARIAALMSEGRSNEEIAQILGITSRRLYQIKAENDASISAAIAEIEVNERNTAIERGVVVQRAVEIKQSGSVFARDMAALAAQYTPRSIEMLAEIRDNPDVRTQDKLRAIELLTRIAGLSTDFVARALETTAKSEPQEKGVTERDARIIVEQLLGPPPEDIRPLPPERASE